MAESDLDYAKVIGRFGLTVGDTADAGDNPDIIWCDEGIVRFIPLITYTKVAGGTPDPFTVGNSVIDAQITDASYVDPVGDDDGAGYVTYRGKPFVFLVDLTSDKVNPHIGPDLATHRVQFLNVKADGTDVEFDTVEVRLTAAGPDGDGINDLTLVMPVAAGSALPIFRGEQGTSITGATIVDGTNLEIELSDGSTIDAGELPSGPGGSDPGVAGYMADPESETATETGAAALDPDHPLGAALVVLLEDIPTEAP